MKPLVVYTYNSCDSCRRAVKWLRAHAIAFTEKPIRETPPTLGELHAMLAHLGGPAARKRLFNTSGQDYRALGLGEKLPALTDAAALELLAANGNLVKRPFALGENVGLVGFDEATWAAALGVG
jgi:arsenate reductase (glutaredoxin)